jgi:hypothetical protein
MTTYWMMLREPPVTDWYIYKDDGGTYSQMGIYSLGWEPKYFMDRHPVDSDYDQVPDIALIIMGLPL